MGLLLKNIAQLVTWDSDKSDMLTTQGVDVRIEGEKIAEIGKNLDEKGLKEVDCRGKCVTAGLIDPHTHPVFARTREKEFVQRIEGRSYLEIAAAGGGIRNSVQHLRKMSEDELFDVSLVRVDRFLPYGTTTIEAKSGYGLNFEDEMKSLRVIRRLNNALELELVPTFLGAHEIPDEYRDKRDVYIDIICNEMIPYAAQEGLAKFCDVFAEPTVYLRDETEKILQAAKDAGLGLRVHADEFESIGVSELAAEMGAASADHLLAVTDAGIKALSGSKTIATLLPGTAFFLGHDHYAPGRKLWDSGARVALASDFNPGSSMTQNLQLIMSIACIYMKLTPLETLQAVTINSAAALLLDGDTGSVETGKQADLVIWNVPNYELIPYHYGMNHVGEVIKNGKIISN